MDAPNCDGPVVSFPWPHHSNSPYFWLSNHFLDAEINYAKSPNWCWQIPQVLANVPSCSKIVSFFLVKLPFTWGHQDIHQFSQISAWDCRWNSLCTRGIRFQVLVRLVQFWEERLTRNEYKKQSAMVPPVVATPCSVYKNHSPESWPFATCLEPKVLNPLCFSTSCISSLKNPFN